MSNDSYVPRCVIRLRTTAWANHKGIHCTKSITFLKKQSYGVNILEEEISAVGAMEAISRIVDLGMHDDGIYEVVVANESRDWETGYIDDYDLILIPLLSAKKGESNDIATD